MTQYNYGYGLSLLIAGVDSSGAHIYRIDNPGRMEIFDTIGHCSIGSGQLHAISTFVANDYTYDLDLNHVVALTYEAKKRSEKAQGVGEQSDIYIVCRDGNTKLPQETISQLEKIYNKRSQQEKRAVAEIEEQIRGLDMAAINGSVKS
jgi:20S proteasome alpha/beta subunit